MLGEQPRKKGYFQVSFIDYFYHVIISAMSFFVDPGGGVALLYASKELEKIQMINGDERRGVEIVQRALKVGL